VKVQLSLSVNFSQTKCDKILVKEYFRPHWGKALPQTIAVSAVARSREDYREPMGGGGGGGGIFASLPHVFELLSRQLL